MELYLTYSPLIINEKKTSIMTGNWPTRSASTNILTPMHSHMLPYSYTQLYTWSCMLNTSHFLLVDYNILQLHTKVLQMSKIFHCTDVKHHLTFPHALTPPYAAFFILTVTLLKSKPLSHSFSHHLHLHHLVGSCLSARRNLPHVYKGLHSIFWSCACNYTWHSG